MKVLKSDIIGFFSKNKKAGNSDDSTGHLEAVGKNKQCFQMHKFRSMKTSAPSDMPTRMLKTPEKYINEVGRFIRSYSFDELPQLWDIFIGNMSIVGPRPVLWNESLLIAERDKYGANDVTPRSYRPCSN